MDTTTIKAVPKLVLERNKCNLNSVQAYEYATNALCHFPSLAVNRSKKVSSKMYKPVIGIMNHASFFQDERSRDSLKINPGPSIFVDDKTWRFWSLNNITFSFIVRWSRS